MGNRGRGHPGSTAINVQAGDVYRRVDARGASPFILIRRVDDTHAYPRPVRRTPTGRWAGAKGRWQRIGLNRFRPALYELVASGVSLDDGATSQGHADA